MDKKGVVWHQLFGAIIMVAVLIVVFLIFFSGVKGPRETLAEGVNNLVSKSKEVFKVLQEPATALDVDPKKFSTFTEAEKSKVLSQTKGKAEATLCNQNTFGGYIGYYNRIIEICKGDKSVTCKSAIPESYFKIAKCYQTVDNCGESVTYYAQLIKNYESSNLLVPSKKGLAECYEKLGNRDRAALIYAEIEGVRFAGITEMEELQKKLGIPLEETYKNALRNYNDENYNLAISRLSDLMAKLRLVEDSGFKRSGSKELKREFQLASLYWIKRAELEDGRLNCESFLGGFEQHLRVQEQNQFLKFPVLGTTYFNEPIVSRIYLAVANCFADKGDKIKAGIYYFRILKDYGDRVPLVIEEMKKKITPEEFCSRYESDALNCNGVNNWADVINLGPIAKEFRCFYKMGRLSSGCFSCSEINSCSQYGSERGVYKNTCNRDPCRVNCEFSGVVGLGDILASCDQK